MNRALTAVEMRVLVEVARGRTNLEIALDLGVSIETVKTYVRRLLRKLDARRRAGAVDAGHRTGLLPLDVPQ